MNTALIHRVQLMVPFLKEEQLLLRQQDSAAWDWTFCIRNVFMCSSLTGSTRSSDPLKSGGFRGKVVS
jgi:hypothetical protein